MKKLVCFFVVTLFCVTLAHAATVGNPISISTPRGTGILKAQSVAMALDLYEAESGQSPIKGGFESEIVFEKDLSSDNTVIAPTLDGYWNMGKLSFTCFEHVEPYVKIGAADVTVEWTQNSNKVKMKSRPGFAWGVGTKVGIWEWPNYGMKLVGDVYYQRADLSVDRVKTDASLTPTSDAIDIQEWQAAIALSKELALRLSNRTMLFVPYIGAKYSDSQVEATFMDGATKYTTNDAGNDTLFGIVAGCDIMLSENDSFSLNIEGRAIDETAMSVGGTVRF